MAFVRLLFLLIPAAVATLFGIGIYENENNMVFGWQLLVLIFVAGTALLSLAVYTSWRVAKWIVGRLGRNQTPS